jgi:hypothetical protein
MNAKMRRLDDLGLVNRQRGSGEGTWLLPLDFGAELGLYAEVLKIVGIKKIRKATGRPFVKRQAA